MHVIKADKAPVKKADNSTQLDKGATGAVDIWLKPQFDMIGLEASVCHSSILPQCIRAYKNNIAGFGIGVRYKPGFDDNDLAAKQEYDRAESIIECLNMDMDTKEVFEKAIHAREIYGIAYIEIIRNVAGEVVGVEFINDTISMNKSIPLEPYIDTIHTHNGHSHSRKRMFRQYRQQVNGQIVFFKEIGDPRIMDKRNGEYVEQLDIYNRANEILELSIGTRPYGEVRWVGQIYGVDGSRKAEKLNNRYFDEGRHTPLLIMVKGGTLSDESFTKLQDYMNDIKGENGQHAFMVLETESADNQVNYGDGDDQIAPSVEIKDLASILQRDELFQDYLDNNRKRVQSAFQLPDLYVGYTTDFNRATAQTAQEVTEKQVFQPERRSLAWIINNKLLVDYGFQYVEAYFKEPDITNPDDLARILSITERAGGLTPNEARAINAKMMGKDSEDYDGEWANIPLVQSRAQNSAAGLDGVMLSQFNSQIQKAHAGSDAAVVAVMKEVRDLLKTGGAAGV